MTRRLFLRPRAEADLAEIWAHTVAAWSREQAAQYLDGLDRTLALLTDHPDIARLRPEFHPPVRLHPYRMHLVIFMADETRLEVIRIVHARSDWQALLQD